MFRLSCWVVFLTGFASPGLGAERTEPWWLSPEVGPFSPSVHFNGAVGDSSGHADELAVGHHDPSREDGTVQGLEIGTSLRLGQLEGFATYNLSYGSEEEWEDEWEEAFLKLKDLPGGFEIRGGRQFARFGKQNTLHLHSWQFVDMPLVAGRFLGEDGLIIDGGDVTWLHQGVGYLYGFTAGYGDAMAHDHGHEEDHEEDHDEDEHAHDEEGVSFQDDVVSGRFFAQFRNHDFVSYEAGVSAAMGDDEADRRIVVYGIDFTRTWRENGLEPGGRALTWVTELLYRDVEDGSAHEHHEEHEDDDHEGEDADEEDDDHALDGDQEFGFYSQMIYTMNQAFDLGGRIDYVAGSDALNSDERLRISPAVTAYLDPYRRSSLRVQYNYDDLPEGEDAHTIWLQFGLTWGGSEVR